MRMLTIFLIIFLIFFVPLGWAVGLNNSDDAIVAKVIEVDEKGMVVTVMPIGSDDTKQIGISSDFKDLRQLTRGTMIRIWRDNQEEATTNDLLRIKKIDIIDDHKPSSCDRTGVRSRIRRGCGLRKNRVGRHKSNFVR